MDKEKLKQLILHTNPDQDYYEEIQAKLSSELDKPHSDRDYDLIEELSDAVNSFMGTDAIINKRSEIGIAHIKHINALNKKKHTTHIIRIVTPCICTVLLILSNVWSYSVLGINSFSAMYQIMSGGITIDFSKKDDPSIPAINLYQDQMQQICTAHNIDAILPTYIPSDYVPTDLFGQVNEKETFCIISFYFKHKDSVLLLQVLHYVNLDEMPPIGIPTDHYNITEEVIEGTTISISKEDQQFTAAFAKDTTQYLLFSGGLDYDECQRVLESMFT